MRSLVTLGLSAAVIAFGAPAMAQAPDFLHGNGGGHAVGGGGYSAGNAGSPAGNGQNLGGGPQGYRPNNGGGNRGGRQYGGNGGGYRQYGGGYRRHNGFGGAAIGAGVAGLAAGALIGGAIANQQPGYGYGYNYGYAPPPPAPAYVEEDVQPIPADGGSVSYCEQRYRSYDPASGTYAGYDGLRHPCP